MSRMSPDRWRRVSALLDEALELTGAERNRFLEEACGGDMLLRADVEAFLAADADTSALLDSPIAAVLFDATGGDAPQLTRIDRRIGAYRVGRELGHGGMGTVYLAERADGQFEQQVALKLARSGFGSADLVRRFLHERQILARLEHPHIARLLDGSVTDDGLPFFVMEYVEGEPITVHCDRRQLPVSARLRLFADVCDAVAYAHRNLIVHRDLKPSNILVTADGRVKLLDFGIAKLLDESAASAAAGETRTGAYLLTPEYAAPEQVRGDPITTATDVYALGAVLYEMLSGRRAHPIAQRSPAEAARVVEEVTPSPPSHALLRMLVPGNAPDGADAPAALAHARGTDAKRLQRALRGDLDAIVMKALRKEPAQRYASVDALITDLERQRSGLPVAARRGSASYRARKYIERHRGAVAATALVMLALAGGLAAATRQAHIARREAARAEEVTDFLIGLFRASDPLQARGRTLTVLELLDSGAVRVERELGNEPELQAEMLTVLGSIYRELAALPRADTLLRRAVAVRERLYGSDSERVVESLNQLGGLLLVNGDYAAADSVLRRALSIRERVLGPRDTLVAVSLNNLALARANLGDDDEAARLYRRALEIDRRVYGAEHLQVATDLSNLGGLLRRQGEHDAADSAISAALATRRRLLPNDDPKIADALAQFAQLRGAQGRTAEAEQLHREALAIRRAAYGDAHPDVALSLGNLASSMSALGRLDEAAPLQREALAIQERVLGPDHDQTIATVNNMGVLSYRRGDLDAAVSHMREAVTRWRRVLGVRHPRVLTATNNLGVVLTDMHAYGEAEPLLRSALEERRTLYGDEHPDVAASLRNVGVLLHRTGRHTDSEQAFVHALDIGRNVWSSTHPRLAEVLLSYGELLLDRARPHEAEVMLTEALTIRRNHFAEDAAKVDTVKGTLARALAAQSRHDEAAALLRPGGVRP
jgi:serine/threonine protein kinase/tetratricopeptide (TPR) repeat protein